MGRIKAFTCTFILHFILSVTDKSCATVLGSDYAGPYMYHLHYSIGKYGWERAKETCTYRDSGIARHPIPTNVMNTFISITSETDLNTELWITNQRGECLTLKNVCEAHRNNFVGSGTCLKSRWDSERVPCSSRRRYLICQTGILPTRKTTTTSTTTTPTTTTSTTTTPTTTPTTATTSTTPSTPVTTVRSLITLPTTRVDDVRSTAPEFNFGLGDLTPPTTTTTTEPTKVNECGVGEVACLASFLTVLSFGERGLLGLIIAVVCGVFLIAALCAAICCACHRTSTPATYKRKYELVHGYSSTPVGGHQPSADHRTDTTDETSLDASSDGRSRSLRRDEFYGSMLYPAILPPPPLLHEDLDEEEYPKSGYLHHQDNRRFHSLQTRQPIHAVDNNIYATINRYRKPSHTSVLDSLPPPPPPPPPVTDAPILQFSDEDAAARGLSQCSVAGCGRTSRGGSERGHGTVNSRKSTRSTRSSNRHRAHRQSPTPSLTSSRKSSSRRKSSKGQSLELVSTNL